jgi:ornithine carbamoyltransferase
MPSARPAPWATLRPVTRNFLSVDDLDPGELGDLLDLATRVKQFPSKYLDLLDHKSVALLFEKPSTRARISFEVAITELGAHPVSLSETELLLGERELIEDTGRALSRYVQAIVLRTFGQERLEALARAASIPVLNALSDYENPCQCLADLLTMRERLGDVRGRVLTYLGDGNNTATSLLLGATKLGMTVRVAGPPGYEPIPLVVDRAREIAEESGGRVEILHDPFKAAEGADILYTDVWASIGQEEEATERPLVFQAYQLNAAVVERAGGSVVVLHCLPAQRGQEITDDVLDGPHSAVWDQAENRLHVQKALLLRVLGAG